MTAGAAGAADLGAGMSAASAGVGQDIASMESYLSRYSSYAQQHMQEVSRESLKALVQHDTSLEI